MFDRLNPGSNENPGPGTYAAEKVKLVTSVKDMMNNSFMTKVPRFCPTAPGSSVFKEPTYVQNPGPGTHFKSLKFVGNPNRVDASRDLYNANQHKELLNIPKAKPPSIPAKKISS